MIYGKKVDVSRLVTVRDSFEGVEQGFKDLASTPEKYLKIIGLI